MPKCYRIYFDDNSAILRDAASEQDAIDQANTYLNEIQPLGNDLMGMSFDDILCIDRVECLD